MTGSHTASPLPQGRRAIFAGRQNSGKTSVVMQLTRSGQRPVNFPGSSVGRSESKLTQGGKQCLCVDLPGLGSLEAISPDERLAVEYLRSASGHDDSMMVVVMDASKLAIELHLLKILASLRLPTIVALTKTDAALAHGISVDVDALQAALGVPVIAVDGLRGSGIEPLRQTIVGPLPPALPQHFDPSALAASASHRAHPSRAWTDRLDRILLHPILGLPIAALLMYLIFHAIFSGSEPVIGWIEAGQTWLADAVGDSLAPGALRSLVQSGLIGGLGSVLVFVPQIAILMTLVSLLEASGYMARMAFLLDRILAGVGLSGRSFVPLASSFACAIPGILATRILEDERDRLATIAVAPLMSCSARLPVYVLLIGAFFPAAWGATILFGLYALGIGIAACVAWLLRRTTLRGESSVLLMELPDYQPPSPRVVGNQVWSATREFLVRAGTIIFIATLLIWVLSYYPRPIGIHESADKNRAATTAMGLPEDEEAELLAAIDAKEANAFLEQSYLAQLGKAVQPVFEPAGFDWRISVGILAAFPAREVIVPTLGILYGVGDVDPGAYAVSSLDEVDSTPDGLRQRLQQSRGEDGEPNFTPKVALALMVFFALCSQCVSTLGTVYQETKRWQWPVFVFLYMTALAWIAATAVYQWAPLR